MFTGLNKKRLLIWMFSLILSVVVFLLILFKFLRNDQFRFVSYFPAKDHQTNTTKMLFTPPNSKDKKYYQVDFDKKIIYPYDQTTDNSNSENFAEYIGIPKEEKSSKVSKDIVVYLMSLDKTKFLVNYVITDLTSPISDYDGSQTVISLTRYLCDKNNKTCILSDLINKANSWDKLGKSPIEWYWWDSNKKILLGATPEFNQNVAMYDYQNNIYKIIKSADYKYFCISASPSQEKMVTCEGNQITLSDNHLNKIRQYTIQFNPIVEVTTAHDKESIDFALWSYDEKTVYFVTNFSVYTLDLSTGKSLLIYQNNQKHDLNRYEYRLSLSSNGKYLAVVDYESKVSGTYKVDYSEFNGKTLVLKVIDLQQKNKITEVMRGDGIWIW